MTTTLKVGETWDLALNNEGMKIHLAPSDKFSALTLLVFLNKTIANEIKVLTESPIQFAVTQSDVLTWIKIFAGEMDFDAPYASGIEKNSADIRSALSHVDEWTDGTRNAVTIIITDPRNNKIQGLRMTTLSKTWWSVFSRSVLAGPETMTSRDYDAAQARDLRR